MSHRTMNEIVDSESGVKVPVYFDDDDQRFHADYNEGHYARASYPDLQFALLHAIKRNFRMSWVPLIQIGSIFPDTSRPENAAFCGFHLDRHWTALWPDKTYRNCHWDKKDNGILENYRSELKWAGEETMSEKFFPCSIKGYGNDITYFFVYDEDLWQLLQKMKGQIEHLQTQLNAAFYSGHKIVPVLGAILRESLGGNHAFP